MTKQVLDAHRLDEAWKAAVKRAAAAGMRRPTQKAMAALYGVTAGNIGHYISGLNHLNTDWKIRFAIYLNTDPSEIWPDFHKTLIHRTHPPDAELLLEQFAHLDETDQEFLRRWLLMRSTGRRRVPASRPSKPAPKSP